MVVQKYSQDGRLVTLTLVVALLVLGSSACGGNSTGSAPAAPAAPTGTNRAPVVANLSVSPSGMGLQSATLFTFTSQGVSDPDGDALTYAWVSTDGATIASATQSTTHAYARSGAFDMRLTVTDAKGLSTTVTTTVNVGNLSGTWDVTCDSHPASFPSQFVVSLTQSNALLSGTISGGGQSQAFPAPPTAADASVVSDPKHVVFGVETAFNVWAGRDGDFYFHMTADETLTTMTGSSQYCLSASSRRR
jgi:PKD repeat protein